MSYYKCISVALLLVILTSCVTQRVHDDVINENKELEIKNNRLEAGMDSLKIEYQGLLEQNRIIETKLKELNSNVEKLKQDTTLMGSSIRNIQRLHGDLSMSYENLLKSNREILQEKIEKNERLLNDLENLRNELNAKEISLDKKDVYLSDMNKELEAREVRLKELESILSEKDKQVSDLRKTVSDALLGFRDQGLTVSVQNGKVYVSLEERLMFESGSYKVDKTGKKALIELAKVLNQQADISVLVEGHTDNVPLGPSSKLADNWDLSVLRSTEVVRILTKEGKVLPERVIAAGRGEFMPIADNNSAESRRKNRRIEIILSPNLDKLFDLIEK